MSRETGATAERAQPVDLQQPCRPESGPLPSAGMPGHAGLGKADIARLHSFGPALTNPRLFRTERGTMRAGRIAYAP